MSQKEWTPGRLLETSGYYWRTCTLHAGVKLDLFTLIGDGALTRDEVAGKISGDGRGVATLLNALTAMGLLAKTGDSYSNTPVGKSLLSKDSPEYLGHMIMHHHHLVDSWRRLDESVTTGRPVRTHVTERDEQHRAAFLMGMFNMAMAIAPGLVREIDLGGRRHLLDLGGGPGTYAIHFCKNNPGLRATIYDLPTTRPFAEQTVERFGMADRIDFTEGNYLEDEVEGDYDVAWLSQVLHGEGPEDCRGMIRKAVSALQSGGMILVHEFILNDSMDSPPFPALFSLNMLLGTDSGRSYSEGQIREMLAQAGVTQIERLPFQGPNDSGILTGIIP